jgi:hypothetical protein
MANVVLSDVSKSYGNVEVVQRLNLPIGDGSFTFHPPAPDCGTSDGTRTLV